MNHLNGYFYLIVTGLDFCNAPDAGPGEPHFEGLMDDMRIYNCALTAEEIAGFAFPIPSLPQWGLILLGSMLAVGASSRIVMRMRQSSR